MLPEVLDLDCCLPHRLDDGRICVPAGAVAPDGAYGDGVVHLAPSDAEYAEWNEYLRRRDGK